MISTLSTEFSGALLGQLFLTPLRVPTTAAGLLWALPICLGIAVVYKAIKVETFSRGSFIREVSFLFATIIGFLIVVGAILWAISHYARYL